jgi:hypothetical protein
MTITIGDSKRWWNRKFSARPLLAIAVLVVILGMLLPHFGDAISAALWDIAHLKTASFHGEKIALPWMWKQEDTWEAWRTLSLRHAQWGVLYGNDRIIVQYDEAGSSKTKQLDSFEGFNRFLVQPGEKSEVFAGNPFMMQHYNCRIIHWDRFRIVLLMCVSHDGHLIANFNGNEDGVTDFESTLAQIQKSGFASSHP